MLYVKVNDEDYPHSMDDYKISLSDDEKKAIKDAAKEFSKDNDKDNKKKVSGDTEYVERYLTLVTIKQKMTDAIEAEVDTNVTDDEAKQKAMQYVLFSINTTDANGVYQSLSDEEKANVKANAEAFAEERVLTQKEIEEIIRQGQK